MLSIKKEKEGNARIFQLSMNKYVYALVLLILVIIGLLYLKSRYVVPIERVSETSQLVMLGDLNNDNDWNASDRQLLDKVIDRPWEFNDTALLKMDINRNQVVDNEDIDVLKKLYEVSNPYRLQSEDRPFDKPAPKARELFRYLSAKDYIQRPLYGLEHKAIHEGPLAFLSDMRLATYDSPYLTQLSHEIYDEALRFSFIHAKRKATLSSEEEEFVRYQLDIIRQLHEGKNYYEMLLHLILLSEAGETLSTERQPTFVKNVRFLAESLRAFLVSPRYAAFKAGKISWEEVFRDLDSINKNTAGLDAPLHTLQPARDLTDPQNYIDRAEWQYYKSKTTDLDFQHLVSFAQNDRRYLRAVSNTSARHQDMSLQNHNLPMMLLFGQAMAIAGNDKKSAVGLLDETIRIPFFWVKTLPAEIRPTSVALEHFLLPGNMEDGSDKSRHWNVFGGLSLYRSPEESLTIAFQREVEDVRKANHSPEAMTEFIRDMIANCYGIYHIVSYDKK